MYLYILISLLFNFYIKECVQEVALQDEGCFVGSSKCNILAYADDIILMAPSANGLQKLVGTFGESIKQIKLRVNGDKSKYMVFKHNRKLDINSSIYLNEELLERVYVYKYLGIMLKDDLSNGSDVERVMSNFLTQFNALYHKFNFASQNVLNFLFKTYSSSFYGIELWYNDRNRLKNMHKISVAYHKAIKRVVNLNTWDSNHIACEIIGVNLFQHLQAKRMHNYYRSVLKSKNHYIQKTKYYWNYI